MCSARERKQWTETSWDLSRKDMTAGRLWRQTRSS